MAHNLNFVNGEAAIAFAGDVPWHGLGTQVDGLMTAEEAIVKAHMDWDVKLFPLYAQIPDTSLEGNSDYDYKEAPNKYAVVRMDTKDVLGVVGGRYTPVSNRKCFEIFDAVVGDGGAKYEVAGALGKGEVIWLLAKIPGEMRIFGTDDISEKWLLLTSSHDGSYHFSMDFNTVRVVCQNTLNLAKSLMTNPVRFKHTMSVLNRVDDAREMLGFAISTFDKTESIYNELARNLIKADRLSEYVDRVFPNPDPKKPVSTQLSNVREEVINQFDSPTNRLPGTPASMWNAYNAVTQYVDHKQTIRKLDEDPTNRLKHIWIGRGAEIKNRALETAWNMVSDVSLKEAISLN